jgi:hypothetical protein
MYTSRHLERSLEAEGRFLLPGPLRSPVSQKLTPGGVGWQGAFMNEL